MIFNKYRTLLLLSLFVAVVALCFHFYSAHQIEREALLDALPATESRENLSNQELRLALLRQEVKTNPPFSLSRADLDILDQAIVALDEDRISFETLYTSDVQNVILEDYLYPITFLQNSVLAERERRNFLNEPNEVQAAAYLKALRGAAYAYTDHITKLKGFIEVSEQFPYGLIDGSIENHSLLAWLTELEQRTEAGLQWIALQEQCVKAYNDGCTTPPSLAIPIDERSAPVSMYTDLELDFANEFTQLESTFEPTGGSGEPFAGVPLIEYHGYCSKDGDAQVARVWWNKMEDRNLPYVRFVYVDEPLFFSHEENKVNFSEFMINQGVPYQHQPVNHYMCNHYGPDLTSVTSAYGVWSYVKDKPVKTESATALAQLRQHESILRESTSTVRYVDVIEYLTEVAEVLRNTTTDLSAAEREDLETILLAFNDGSMFYEEKIGSLLKLFEFSYANFKRIAVPNAEYIVLGFSAMPITLLADNPVTLVNAGLPVQNYTTSGGYPHLISGLETLQNQKYDIADPLEYLRHTLQVISKLKLQTI